MLQLGYKQERIARSIGKNKSVVSREIKRNTNPETGKYDYNVAEQMYRTRMKTKPKVLSFTANIKRYVDEKLTDDWSPEQISQRAKRDHIDCVSHERIYQYVWYDKKAGGTLYQHLRRKGRKYRKRGSSKDSRGIIKDRVDIDLRPEIVNQKQRFGDLEIDTMIGKNHKGALLTINDRASGWCWLRKLSGKSATDLANETVKVLTPWKKYIHTITADNGKEFAKHKQIAKELNIDFFFAKPYHSWERGANENMNGLIRQYIPKKTDLKKFDKQYVKYVQHKLNSRPRKRLEYFSPFEFLSLNLCNNKVAFVT